MTQRSALDTELSKLDDDILKLGSMCEKAVGDAMDSLGQRDVELAQEVIVGDDQINQLRYSIEERGYRVLATQQPAASDLRHVIAVIHIASELERIGDHAAGIATLVERLDGYENLGSLGRLPKMARRVQKMIRESMQAFIARDATLAAAAIERDEKIDRQYGRFSETIFTEMNQSGNDQDILVPTYLLWMAHNLERIGDRVTNIGERVIYMITGKFVEADL